MEKYLNKCLDSLLIPELDQIEVLVINDGSKDRSSEIAHEYEKKYPGSFRVIDKENGNYGSCINRGIKEATGRYLKILDSDDTFDKSVFSKIIQKLKNIDSDVIVTDFDIVDENGNLINKTNYQIEANRKLAFSYVKNGLLKNSQMHGLMYLREFIINLKYHQSEGISYTDTEWTFIPLASAESFFYIRLGSLYRYLKGREGQTMDPSLFHKKLPDQMKVLSSRAKSYEIHKFDLSNERLLFLEESFKKHANNLYLSVIQSNNISSKQILYSFDEELYKISIRLYSIIAKLDYLSVSRYKYIKKFRDAKIPYQFRIPLYIRITVKLKYLLNKINPNTSN